MMLLANILRAMQQPRAIGFVFLGIAGAFMMVLATAPQVNAAWGSGGSGTSGGGGYTIPRPTEYESKWLAKNEGIPVPDWASFVEQKAESITCAWETGLTYWVMSKPTPCRKQEKS